jgi:SPP1 gp7 family putative phage head morphogenesis protein
MARLTETLQEKGWWGAKDLVDPLTGKTVKAQLGSARRLSLIYDTNLRTAEAAGRWEQMQATRRERPYLRYVCMNLPTSRPEHAAWHDTVLPKDDPWWDTHYPPNGWNCRCVVMELAEKDLKRYGLRVSDSSRIPCNGTVEWVDERSFKTRTVSEGIDPAFDYNPGKAAASARAGEALDEKLAGLSPGLAEAARRGLRG